MRERERDMKKGAERHSLRDSNKTQGKTKSPSDPNTDTHSHTHWRGFDFEARNEPPHARRRERKRQTGGEWQ